MGCARELLSDARGGVGYLLKDRVSRVGEFTDALRRVAGGGTVMDAEVIAQLLTRPSTDPVATLTPARTGSARADGAGTRQRHHRRTARITENAIHKHIGNIFAKLDRRTMARR